MNTREQTWGFEPTQRPKGQRRGRAKPAVGEQQSLAHVRAWGGPRPNSGRKAGARPRVWHRARAVHASWNPVHVTLRRAKGVPSLRSERLRRLLERAIRETRREGFRIVEYSVQADHVHLVVEAADKAALSNGMRSFSVRVAMRVNRDFFGRRRGRVWGDRYHRRDLRSPSEVRKTLVYVLSNHIKHGETDVGRLDPCSSGPWFQGWIHVLDPPAEPSPVESAESWLLRQGWIERGGGYIHLGEVPRAACPARG